MSQMRRLSKSQSTTNNNKLTTNVYQLHNVELTRVFKSSDAGHIKIQLLVEFVVLEKCIVFQLASEMSIEYPRERMMK